MPAEPARVVLVHSPPHGEVDFLSMGLAYLQAVLEQRGLETVLHDVCFAEHHAGTDFYDEHILGLAGRVGGEVGDGVDPRLLMEVVHPEAFDLLSPSARAVLRRVAAWETKIADSGEVFLFTVNVLTQYFAAALASRLRGLGKRTAAGGPNLGFTPLRHLLLRVGAFDAVVVGDGERVVGDLVESLARRRPVPLPGVSRLGADGAVEESPPAAPLPVDSLPRPSLAGMTLTYFVPILASRGCPRRCAFCSETTKPRFRQRAAEPVVAEMEWAAARYRQSSFHFHDDLINASPRWVDRFCALLVERGHRFEWESFCGPEGLTPARLDAMRRSGCVLLKLGVQSFSDRVLRAMRRRRGAAALARTIVHGARVGISMRYDLLTCFPGETEADHQRNLEVVEEVFARTEGVHFSPNPFYLSLGSETHLRAEAHGIVLRYSTPESLPGPLAATVRESGRFPVGFTYGIPQETVRRRLGDLGAVLRRHGKDYLYLGQTAAPVRRRSGASAPGRGAAR